LVVDDETQIQRLLTIALEGAGYRVSTASTGQEALQTAAHQKEDVLILDLGLPDMSGLQVLKRLREWTQTPVIVLTVHDAEAEKVEALDAGADDYVTKPFNTAELLARIRASVRRSNQGQNREPVVNMGDVKVDLASRRVTVRGEPVKLTAKEFALLRLFILNSGKVLTHRQILKEVWGPDHQNDTQYLRVYLMRLREKLERDGAAKPLFETEPGVGYRLAEGAE
jgi:two-component system, OmpR family, KDP operon response regulator KdpE